MENVSDLVKTILRPSGIDQIVSEVESRAQVTDVDLTTTQGRLAVMTSIGQIETIQALLSSVIAEHLRRHPDDVAQATDSLALIKTRFEVLRTSMISRLPLTDEAEMFVFRRLGRQHTSLDVIAEFVGGIRNMKMGVAEIDEVIASLLEPPLNDWGPFGPELQQLTYKAVFEMTKLRAAAMKRSRGQVEHLPSQMMVDGAIVDELREYRVSYEVATEIVAATRAGRIPYLFVAD